MAVIYTHLESLALQLRGQGDVHGRNNVIRGNVSVGDEIIHQQ